MHPKPSEAPSLYINIHTADPEAALAFFKAIGLTQVTEYSDDNTKALCLPSPNTNVCLMVHGLKRFKEFIRPGTDINDATKTTEALFSIAVPKREDVDEWLAKAVKAGGSSDPFALPNYGGDCGMYTRSFADLDGHIWEVCAMLVDCAAGSKPVA